MITQTFSKNFEKYMNSFLEGTSLLKIKVYAFTEYFLVYL